MSKLIKINLIKAVSSLLCAALMLTACGGAPSANEGQSEASASQTQSGLSSAASQNDIQNDAQSGASSASQTQEEMSDINITLTINGQAFPATLKNNEATAEFVKLFPLTVTMDELNGNEKYHYLDVSLPTNARTAADIESGEIMLYGSSCLVLFYESFPSGYSYTTLGALDDASGLKSAVGAGSVDVTFAIAD